MLGTTRTPFTWWGRGQRSIRSSPCRPHLRHERRRWSSTPRSLKRRGATSQGIRVKGFRENWLTCSLYRWLSSATIFTKWNSRVKFAIQIGSRSNPEIEIVSRRGRFPRRESWLASVSYLASPGSRVTWYPFHQVGIIWNRIRNT